MDRRHDESIHPKRRAPRPPGDAQRERELRRYEPAFDGLQQLVTADSHVAGDAARDTAKIQFDGMNIEYWPIGQPIPYAKNARKLSSRALEVVAASLKEFGWGQPILGAPAENPAVFAQQIQHCAAFADRPSYVISPYGCTARELIRWTWSGPT